MVLAHYIVYCFNLSIGNQCLQCCIQILTLLSAGLLHYTQLPYCKKGRSAKVKDGIRNLILGNISLIDTSVCCRQLFEATDILLVRQETSGAHYYVLLNPIKLGQNHRYHNTRIERANMHCQGIAYTRSYGMGLTQAEGQ
jgi:hypothetical protein